MLPRSPLFNSYLPAIGFWLFVLILMCTPGQDFPKLGSWTELISLDKIIHVLLFGTMAYLFMRASYHRLEDKKQAFALFLKIALAISLWGLTTEFIQKFWVEGRSFDLFDFIADSIGAFVAYLIAKKRCNPQAENC